MRRVFTVVAAFALALTASADSRNNISRTFDVGDGGTIRLNADVGDVHVTTGGSGKVTIEIVRRARDAEDLQRNEVTFSQSGSDVTVRSRYENDRHSWFSWKHDSIDIDYNIRIPARYNVDLHTSGGDIEGGDIGGNADLNTSGGNLKLNRVSGNVHARTSGGEIDLDSAGGTVTLNTSGGDIEIRDAASSVEAKTSGGSIEIHRAGGTVLARTSGGSIRIDDVVDTVNAETSGGSITAHFSRQPRGDSRLSTSGGGVTVELAPSIGAELDARASGGGVQSDVPITVQGTHDDDSLVGRINGGGPRLVLRTSGGGIVVRRG